MRASYIIFRAQGNMRIQDFVIQKAGQTVPFYHNFSLVTCRGIFFICYLMMSSLWVRNFMRWMQIPIDAQHPAHFCVQGTNTWAWPFLRQHSGLPGAEDSSDCQMPIYSQAAENPYLEFSRKCWEVGPRGSWDSKSPGFHTQQKNLKMKLLRTSRQW